MTITGWERLPDQPSGSSARSGGSDREVEQRTAGQGASRGGRRSLGRGKLLRGGLRLALHSGRSHAGHGAPAGQAGGGRYPRPGRQASLRDARGEGRKGIGRQHAQDHEPHRLTLHEDRPRKKAAGHQPGGQFLKAALGGGLRRPPYTLFTKQRDHPAVKGRDGFGFPRYRQNPAAHGGFIDPARTGCRRSRSLRTTGEGCGTRPLSAGSRRAR